MFTAVKYFVLLLIHNLMNMNQSKGISGSSKIGQIVTLALYNPKLNEIWSLFLDLSSDVDTNHYIDELEDNTDAKVGAKNTYVLLGF